MLRTSPCCRETPIFIEHLLIKADSGYALLIPITRWRFETRVILDLGGSRAVITIQSSSHAVDQARPNRRCRSPSGVHWPGIRQRGGDRVYRAQSSACLFCDNHNLLAVIRDATKGVDPWKSDLRAIKRSVLLESIPLGTTEPETIRALASEGFFCRRWNSRRSKHASLATSIINLTTFRDG